MDIASKEARIAPHHGQPKLTKRVLDLATRDSFQVNEMEKYCSRKIEKIKYEETIITFQDTSGNTKTTSSHKSKNGG